MLSVMAVKYFLLASFWIFFINSTNEDECIETCQWFHWFKQRPNKFIAAALFYALIKNPVLFWIEAEYISPRYYI